MTRLQDLKLLNPVPAWITEFTRQVERNIQATRRVGAQIAQTRNGVLGIRRQANLARDTQLRQELPTLEATRREVEGIENGPLPTIGRITNKLAENIPVVEDQLNQIGENLTRVRTDQEECCREIQQQSNNNTIEIKGNKNC
jgi:hypothetical protein